MRRDDVIVESLSISTPAGAVQVLLFKPAGSKPDRPAILHTHSGGSVAGSPEPIIGLCQTFPHELDCIVASVDYRLAPEHPFPAGLWLHVSASQLGANPKKIAITGERRSITATSEKLRPLVIQDRISRGPGSIVSCTIDSFSATVRRFLPRLSTRTSPASFMQTYSVAQSPHR